MILNGVDIKRSCFTEVNINIQQFVLLLYTTVIINVHIQLHDFQCTSTVHQKVTQRHAAVCIIQLRLTVKDLEFSAYLQAGQAKVQLKSEKQGT